MRYVVTRYVMRCERDPISDGMRDILRCDMRCVCLLSPSYVMKMTCAALLAALLQCEQDAMRCVTCSFLLMRYDVLPATLPLCQEDAMRCAACYLLQCWEIR
jgi:hypothetical protein